MAKNITIRVPGKHPQTGELTTFELKGQRMDIDIGGQAVPFLIHGRGIGTSLTHIPSGYRIALLGSWLTARYAIPENKPMRPDGHRPAGGPVRLTAPAGPAQLQAGYQRGD
ncbi:hypothetical protein [Aeromonas caviae]|uniref:hypothetical protein n=1 Tax=Aeromonas caviae TaxID=648 RepID=UPI0015DC1FBA|nr:hypothetical protein [Aeromonas caviae]BBS15933.1 hypothetical protein WP5W18E02_09700 [Aeromonas caviae]